MSAEPNALGTVDPLAALADAARARQPLGADQPAAAFTADGRGDLPQVYANTHERLNIDFSVARLAFAGAQTMDPRVVRIPPGKNNERHRHAHESLFVVLKGQAQVLVGEEWVDVAEGQIAFIPRWIFHQSRNPSDTEELVILAVTDFGFTSAVLGDYDKRTRLARGGDQATG